jgi:hypothetical protein
MDEIDNELQSQIKKIKEEYNNNIINEKIKLLISICNDENLDFEKIKNKYIKMKDFNKNTIDNHNMEILIDEDLLDKIQINKIDYYYENKENGNVYDMESNIVGVYINGKILLN